MAIKVTLREKKISKGRLSLYLDFYPPIPHPITGEPTRREFLGLYIFQKASNPIDKEHNKSTKLIANNIRQKKENFLNKPEIYSQYEKDQLRIKELGERCFIEYYKTLANKRKKSNHDNWMSALKYLVAFSDGQLLFKDLNEKVLEEFKEYLLTTKSTRSDKAKLSPNSAVSYFNKIKASLKQAYKDGILQKDLNSFVKPIKQIDTRREYLTVEELNNLINTPCNNELIKKAAIFSALTGMAFKEIENMIWKDVQKVDDDEYTIVTKRQKTGKDNYLPISKKTYDFLGERHDDNLKVFEGLKYSAYHNKHIYQWLGAAGITKDITFHNFRHTYATLQLMNETDITTVSKLLGHKNLKTTMIYAKVVDKSKRDAADKIQLDL